MTVRIEIYGENAAQAIAELRAVAAELSVVSAPEVVVGPTPSAEPVASNVVPLTAASSEAPAKPRGRPRKQTESQPAPSPQVSAETQDAPSPSPAPAPAATVFPAAEVSDADMRAALQRLAMKFPGNDGLNMVVKIIGEHADGAQKVKDVKPEHRAAVYAAAEKALNA